MKFCKTCGYGMDETAQICTHCTTQMDKANTLSDDKLKELANRVRISAIIWLIIGIVQVCMVATCIVGFLNIWTSIQNLQISKNMMTRRVGLVKAYTPMTGFIITLLYNLIFGGVIGIVGSLYYYFCIRGYVMDNKEYFNTLK